MWWPQRRPGWVNRPWSGGQAGNAGATARLEYRRAADDQDHHVAGAFKIKPRRGIDDCCQRPRP
jgi:hypothetical protein